MRRIALPALLLVTVALAACSYTTDLVVLNATDKPIEVRYQIRDSAAPFHLPVTPATKSFEELNARGTRWNDLTPSQYALHTDSRTVMVVLMPRSALRVSRLHRAGMQIDEADDAATFTIDEIKIVGANGEVRLRGDQVRKAFLPESKKTFVLRYE